MMKWLFDPLKRRREARDEYVRLMREAAATGRAYEVQFWITVQNELLKERLRQRR